MGAHPPPRPPAAHALRIAYLVQQALADMPPPSAHRIYVLTLASALRRAGHDVRFFASVGSAAVRLDPDRVPLQSDGADEARRGVAGQLLRWATLGTGEGWRYARACHRQLGEVDVIHEHFGLLQRGGVWLRRWTGVPYVLHVHSDDLDELRLTHGGPPFPFSAALRMQCQRSFEAADAIVAVSAAVRHRLIETWGTEAAKIVVIPNAVDEPFFHPPSAARARQELGLPLHARVVAYVGSFHVWYDVAGLVRAVRRVADSVPDVLLLVAGDGVQRPAIERAIGDTAAASIVRLLGPVDHRRIPSVLAASDVAVLPVSRLGGEFWCSPMKLFEYMAAGKPIVASNVGQIAEVIGDRRDGLLVPVADIDALAAALRELLEDPPMRWRLGERARALAEHYTWPRYVEHLHAVYALARARRARPSRDAARRRGEGFDH